ncbi:MAG: Membrane protein of unknown function [Patescibacteria group bacterium]|jgi:putative membrane protein|nr:Membrane protein of unknown function [Patescibacteria group bacterium]
MLIIRWFLNALALLVVANIVPGFQVDSLGWALVAALVLGIANVTIKPILVILSLPITILTLGLFTFVINALVLLGVAGILEGFSIDGFGAALLATLVLTIISWGINALLSPSKGQPAS